MLVIRERDDDLRQLEDKFAQAVELVKQRNEQVEAGRLDWSKKQQALEQEAKQRQADIADLQDKLKEQKRETQFYKKGY